MNEPIAAKPPALFLHGRGGSPEGTVKKLASGLGEVLTPRRIPLLHSDPAVSLQVSLTAFLADPRYQAVAAAPSAYLIVVSMGGLLAVRAQEEGFAGTVVAISSPTTMDRTEVLAPCRNVRRVALYSSTDTVLAGRTGWGRYCEHAYDLSWLTHDTDRHLASLVLLIDTIVTRGLLVPSTLLAAEAS